MSARRERKADPERSEPRDPASDLPVVIQVMDTTLRDGEQTPDVAYSPSEKRELARRLLMDVGVDRIEIASTRVSEGERDAARAVTSWARKARQLQRVEMLGYTDNKASVDWICDVGGKVLNLLTKGSERHCRGQLGLSPEEHRKRVAQVISYARKKRLTVNVYLEDWSQGVRESFDYVFTMVQALRELRVARIYLPDTLGIFSPQDTTRYVGLMTSTWPEVDFEFHGHNDYALATANCMAAVQAGARGVHTSVNGMGERAGNSKLAEVVAALHDFTGFRTNVDEAQLTSISNLVETFSGKEIAANAPLVGRDVFTQTAGIHADGDAKGNLYGTRLAPARFGRARRYALGKLSGKASVDHNLEALGIELTTEQRDMVLQRVIELGDRKKTVSPEDLPYIVSDVLKSPAEQLVRVQHYRVTVDASELPRANVELSFQGRVEKAEATGDGGYDAFMNALKKAAKAFEIDVPRLADFRVRIPPGGRTAALVETLIAWELPAAASGRATPAASDESFTTLGVDSDQMASAVIASEKMLNAVLSRGAKPAAARKTPAAGATGRKRSKRARSTR